VTAGLFRVLARLRVEQPDLYRQWLAEALAEYDAGAQPQGDRRPAVP
jgi:hypothetical protein